MASDPAEQSDHDLLVRMDEKLTIALQRIDDQEGRIRGLEMRVWWAAGVATAMGAGGGLGLDRLLG